TQVLDRFEEAWEGGQPPDLAAFLPPPGLPGRGEALVELAHIDLERRLKGGEPVRVEGYLARFPELAALPERAPGLALTEARVRRRRGEAIEPEEYARRFPDWADFLRSHWAAAVGLVSTLKQD